MLATSWLPAFVGRGGGLSYTVYNRETLALWCQPPVLLPSYVFARCDSRSYSPFGQAVHTVSYRRVQYCIFKGDHVLMFHPAGDWRAGR